LRSGGFTIGYHTDGVVTLKAEPELPIAGPGGRAYAFVIDWHIRLLLAVAWWLIVTLLVAGGDGFGEALVGGSRQAIDFAALPAAFIYFFYHPVLEWWMEGQTPGKRMAGIRIVTRAGAPPSLAAILVRNALRLLDSLPALYCLGFMTTLLTQDHVRIGDLAAGTVLVYCGEDWRPLRNSRSQ
jgi:uncharacterized RDD family membrane protein YckC